MDEVTGELRRWAEEDGGVLFQCRPRGWPPLGFGHYVALNLVLWPHLASAFVVLAQLGMHPSGVELLPAGWGFESPLFPGVVIPWLALSGACVGLGELVRVARHRSRRIVVTPQRVLVSQGVFKEWIVASPRVGLPEVVVGPGGVRTWASGWVALGRLDPLDLEDLARALGAPAPVVEPRTSAGRWWVGLALLTVAVHLLGLVCLPAPMVLVGLWLGRKLPRPAARAGPAR